MPCRDPGAEHDAEVENGLRMNGLTAALCITCKELAQAGKLNSVSKKIRVWYEAHLASDRARKMSAEADNDVETVRKSLEKRGLEMSIDHTLMRLRNKRHSEEQECYAKERAATLLLAELIVENANG